MATPQRRTSALAGQSPVTTLATTPLADSVQSTSLPPKQQSQPPKARRAARSKMTYYASEEDSGRIRAAYYAARDEHGWRNLTDMQLEAIMRQVEAIEARHNNGQPFEPLPAGTGPVGRPLY